MTIAARLSLSAASLVLAAELIQAFALSHYAGPCGEGVLGLATVVALFGIFQAAKIFLPSRKFQTARATALLLAVLCAADVFLFRTIHHDRVQADILKNTITREIHLLPQNISPSERFQRYANSLSPDMETNEPKTPETFKATLDRLNRLRMLGPQEESALRHPLGVEAAREILSPYSSFIEESAKAYNIPPDHLALIILMNVTFKEHDVLYKLGVPNGDFTYSGIEILDRYFSSPFSATLKSVISRMPDSVKNIGLTDDLSNFGAGVVAGGRPTQGIMELRAGEIRDLDPWAKQFGIEAIGLSDRKINIYLANPRLSIWAMAAVIRYGVDQMIEKQAHGNFQDFPDMTRYAYSTSLLDVYNARCSPAWAIDLFALKGFGKVDPVYSHDDADRPWNAVFDIQYADRYIPWLRDVYTYTLATGLFEPATSHGVGHFDRSIHKITQAA
jgi:hypothetical protein